MIRSRSRFPRRAARRSGCPIAGALDVLGDRWTLVLVRDLFAGKQRYGEFQASPEGIPTNILADRLERLEKAGLIASAPYQHSPVRYAYTLTAKGRDLAPVLGAIATWGLRHLSGTRADPAVATALSKPEA